jgi:hypothetical protein
MSMRTPIALAAAAIGPFPAASTARAAVSCRTVGHTVIANTRARVYAYRPGHSPVYGACVYGQRQNLGVFADGGAGLGLQLVDTHLGYVARGLGCERGDCRPDVVRVVDLRHPLAAPAAAIATSFVLAGGGAFAALTQPDASGAIRVLTVTPPHSTTTVIASGAVTPGSLALTGRTVYWTQDGAPRSATLPAAG